jgi:hypothetical protein
MRDTSDTPLPTVQTALANGCQVDALCLECPNISRLDLAKLAETGYGHIPLIWIPLRCLCGSKRYKVIASRKAYCDD